MFQNHMCRYGLLFLCLFFTFHCDSIVAFEPETCLEDLKVLHNKKPLRYGCAYFEQTPDKIYAAIFQDQEFLFCSTYDDCKLRSFFVNRQENQQESVLFAFPPPKLLPTKGPLEEVLKTCAQMLDHSKPPCCWNHPSLNETQQKEAHTNCWMMFKIEYIRGQKATCHPWFLKAPPTTQCKE